MKVLPVLDLLDGVVVRGVAGRREQYQPVVSSLTAGPDAFDLALVFRERLGLTDLYLADLDAILHRAPNERIWKRIADEGLHLTIDAGLRDAGDAAPILAAGAATVVAGLETLAGPDVLRALLAEHGPERITFSLDLRDGRPLCQSALWKSADALQIGGLAFELGVRRIIVLDLAAVGVGAGLNCLDLCRDLLERCPGLEITTGGGVRSLTDLVELQRAGISAALVASALHDGRISRADIDSLQRTQ